MVSYRLIGTGTTDDNGVATCNNVYTGTAKGEVDIVASTDNPIVQGSLLSETYELLDATFYDKASNGVHNRWDIENASIDYSNDYLELSSTNGTQFHVLNMSDGNIIEFDYYCTSLTEQAISLRQSSTSVWGRSLQQMGIDVNTWCNVKIKVNNGEWWIWVNGIDKTPTFHSIGEFNRFFLRVTNDYRIRYKNFVVYPV